MFEERCLTCGSHLQDDGRAYCSDECQTLDSASPSISSTSSAYSSPSLGYAVGGDVPALIPSMLGTALRNFQQDRHSVSSSSASSTAWSVVTDDDDDDPILGTGSDPDSAGESIYETTSKCSTSHSLFPKPLAYARRPSGTNTRSTVPHLHSRTGSLSAHVRGLPSATSHPHTAQDEDTLGDSGFPSRELEDYIEQMIPQSAPERQHNQFAHEQDHSTTITKTKRSRNRTSLPAYFSLLQMNGAQNPFPISQTSKRASPSISNSSGQTVVKPSPPTPKVSLGLPPFVPPRGRRRDVGASQRKSRSDDSFSCSSRSTSDSRHDPSLALSPPRETRFVPRPRLDSRGNTDSVFDCSSVPDPRRGRTAVRRNSSPPPKMTAPMFVFEGRERYRDNTARPHTRGRARVEELDGVGGSEDAPGLGYGRSGLVDRERGHRAGRFRS
ncbi:uncharacterized protein BT62DRAFT_750349 [Guyanagaster necrorhizus]|uniref:Uncharacterized protein n=1 Tax=Guyanagaster necrorhizus TaxID=856835 RepID=A0A9P7VWW3_9AGAR|nr:uncharacterized protein BT62DRAFT_750349 [Guyanagaster necrorhizus MCA 3950]KAG7448047.1 hypothetical protein BT62DRAFT_750349 [Guyanagaster necrorhizus MCA 3950]